MSTKNLPTKKQFQTEADKLKTAHNISRCQAYEKLAKQYGYKTYAAIKDKLIEKQSSAVQIVSIEDFKKMEEQRIFSSASKANTYFKDRFSFNRQRLIDGIAYNPLLPDNFWNNPNEDRDLEELNNWWNVAFIMPNKKDTKVTYTVHRFDGGAWDRPTWKGQFDDFETALNKAQELNNLPSSPSNKFITLKNGAVINTIGLLINSSGIITYHNDATSSFFKYDELVLFQFHIKNIIEKRKNINYKIGSSYTLKSKIEDHFKTTKSPAKDLYLSNGALIVILDRLGFKIKEDRNSNYINDFSINIHTNCKLLF
jgi:hypothetical protein